MSATSAASAAAVVDLAFETGDAAKRLRDARRRGSRVIVVTALTWDPPLPAATGTPDEVGEYLRTVTGPLVAAVRTGDVPVVAALHGPVGGVGLAVALAADLRVAGPSTQLDFSGGGFALPPAVPWLLTHLSGAALASRLLLFDTVLDASGAARFGLVEAAADDPLPDALRRAERLEARAAGAVAAVRRSLRKAADLHFDEAFAYETYLQEMAAELDGDELGGSPA